MENRRSIKKILDEKWAVIRGVRTAFGEKYAISNYGRLVKFSTVILDGSLLKGSLQGGYPIWRYRQHGVYHHALIHRLVAKYFLPAAQRNEKIVIHQNHKKADNRYFNLQWVTQQEAIVHQQGSPLVQKLKKYKRENPGIASNSKLTLTEVKKIKLLLKQNKTLREIALKFKISDMQVYRIKTGENWGYVK